MIRKRLFAVLFLLNLFNYIDRQVLYAVFPLIQTDLHISDFQLGALASVFMLVYMCYAPICGYLADRKNRPHLIAISALIWSAATLAGGAAKNFTHLLTARGAVGIGEGGFTTIAQPFLAEHYPKEKHAWILGLFGLALPLGSALGYILGGIIGQTWGWRLAFMSVSVPGVLLALLAWFLPDRARLSQADNSAKPAFVQYIRLLKNKPFLYVCLIQAVITFLIGGCSAWVPTYFVRHLGLNVAQAGSWFGGLVIVCGAIGTFWGGKWAAERLKQSDRAYYEVMAAALLGCVVPIWLGLSATYMYTALACFGAAIVLLFLPTGAIAAALVDTTPAPMRGMAFAVNIFIIHLLGDALSPSLIGFLSSRWNLETALWMATLVVVPGLWFCHLAARQIKK